MEMGKYDIFRQYFPHLYTKIVILTVQQSISFPLNVTPLQVFVQPFFRSVVGLPSVLQVVRTHPGAAPAAPPQIRAARMLNSTAAFVAWTMLGGADQTGPLIGYQVGRPLCCIQSEAAG